MVSTRYMTAQPARQSALPEPLRRLVYDRAWPLLTDAAGGVEGAAWRAGEAARRAPVPALLAALASGLAAGLLVRAWRRR